MIARLAQLWDRLLAWLGLRPTPGISLELAEVLADLLEEETGYRFSPAKMAPFVVERHGALFVESPDIPGDGITIPDFQVSDLEDRLEFRRRVAERSEAFDEPERFAESAVRREILDEDGWLDQLERFQREHPPTPEDL